jgi:hypothetical protein
VFGFKLCILCEEARKENTQICFRVGMMSSFKECHRDNQVLCELLLKRCKLRLRKQRNNFQRPGSIPCCDVESVLPTTVDKR